MQACSVAPSANSRPPAVASTVFLPKEHGSWSLVLEPLVLGCWIAPSAAGFALATAAFAGFCLRRPLRAALADAPSLRRMGAREAVVMFSALGLAGVFEAGVLGGWSNLWPLAIAFGLGLAFTAWDLQGESRGAAAELAGGAAAASLAGAIAVLAGWSPGAALLPAGLALARSLSAITTVRTYVRARKGAASNRALGIAIGMVIVLVLAACAAVGRVPAAAVLVAAAWAARTCWLLGPWRPEWSARRVGMFEAVLGIASVALLAAICRVAVIP